MAIHPVRSIAALLCALAGTTLAGAACASRPAAPPDAGAQQAPAPLAALASERVVLVPSQRLREVGALGWTASLPSPREFLSGLDDEIAAALAERGVGSGWVM